MTEVARHNSEHDCWIVVSGKVRRKEHVPSAASDAPPLCQVYDTTKFNKLHPGGGSSIFINAGTDTTEEFEAIHSKRAWGQLAEWYIGDLVCPARQLLAALCR